MSLKSNIRTLFVRAKDRNPWLHLLWLKALARRGEKERTTLDDIECMTALYEKYVDRKPNLENPQNFSDKLQWMKLHYRHNLMPVVGDKYTVRKYLDDMGKSYLLNDLIAVYDDVKQFEIKQLPDKFVLKASHGSGWNVIVHDKSKVNWYIWRKIMQYWLTHKIDWQGREWHYSEMTPRIVCEKYLEDKSGGLMDYKFYCFNGEPMFLQINVGRGTINSTQNYYDLDWNLLPFGKSQPHNPDIKVEKPENFEQMIQEAKDLSKPFPYVRMDFYEANGKLYFGEFTFFPCSGMPDFIPTEWDAIVGEMLTLPEANH